MTAYKEEGGLFRADAVNEEEEEEEEGLFKADAVNEEDSERDGTTLSPCYCVHCGGGGGEKRVC